jgi:hypothetical protein
VDGHDGKKQPTLAINSFQPVRKKSAVASTLKGKASKQRWYRAGNRSQVNVTRGRLISLKRISRKRSEVGDEACAPPLHRFARNIGRFDRNQHSNGLALAGDGYKFTLGRFIDQAGKASLGIPEIDG